MSGTPISPLRRFTVEAFDGLSLRQTAEEEIECKQQTLASNSS
jgi:hypothetical protein